MKNSPVVGIVDYGMGNLMSVSKAFESLGALPLVSGEPDDLMRAEGLVLPGVGAFHDCVANLKRNSLDEFVVSWIREGKPFLGICLGLQVLFTKSYEFGEHEGLGIIRGTVKRFPEGFIEYEVAGKKVKEKLKIPHMGWNSVRYPEGSPFFSGIPQDSYFYFVHSYYVDPEDNGVRSARTNYGIEFVSAVEKGNIVAVQFHPEKSQKVGIQFLKNFLQFMTRT